MRDQLAATAESLTYGDVTDFANFGGAVIDRRAFDKHSAALDRIKNAPSCTVLAGGTADDTEGYFVRPDGGRVHRPDPRGVHHRVLRPDPRRPRVPRRHVRRRGRARPSRSPVRADRRGVRHRPGGDRPGAARAAVRGRQLLRQRQADRRGGRPAAVRRRAGQRHQRQGRLVAQPDALGVAAHDQGDVRARRPTTATRTWPELVRAGDARIRDSAKARSSSRRWQ